MICALGWACWKTHLSRPETDQVRLLAMTQLGNGLFEADRYEDAAPVREAELAMKLRLGADEAKMLVVQGNLASTYGALGRHEETLRMRREVYIKTVKIYGKSHGDTFLEAYNYAVSLLNQQPEHFAEAKALLRKTIPAARRVLGENTELALRLRKVYATALYDDNGATLEDLREAVATFEEIERVARRVYGGAHPLAVGVEYNVREARAALRARETKEAFRTARVKLAQERAELAQLGPSRDAT